MAKTTIEFAKANARSTASAFPIPPARRPASSASDGHAGQAKQDHRGARLTIEEERRERERKKLTKSKPSPGEEDPATLSPEERQRRINEIYGRPPDWRPPQ